MRDLNDLFKQDQDDASYRTMLEVYCKVYTIIRELGGPEELAVGIARDMFKIIWKNTWTKS